MEREERGKEGKEKGKREGKEGGEGPVATGPTPHPPPARARALQPPVAKLIQSVGFQSLIRGVPQTEVHAGAVNRGRLKMAECTPSS